MPEFLPPPIRSKDAGERLTQLDQAIARFEAAKRRPHQNDDLLRALRRERDRLAALARPDRLA